MRGVPVRSPADVDHQRHVQMGGARHGAPDQIGGRLDLVLPDTAVLDTEQHLAALLLEADPEALADLRRQAVTAGRNPASLSVSMFAFEGTQSDTLKRYRALGVTRVVLVAPRRLADA